MMSSMLFLFVVACLQFCAALACIAERQPWKAVLMALYGLTNVVLAFLSEK